MLQLQAAESSRGRWTYKDHSLCCALKRLTEGLRQREIDEPDEHTYFSAMESNHDTLW